MCLTFIALTLICSSECARMLKYLSARKDPPFSRRALCSPKHVLVNRIVLFMSAGAKLIDVEDEIDMPGRPGP